MTKSTQIRKDKKEHAQWEQDIEQERNSFKTAENSLTLIFGRHTTLLITSQNSGSDNQKQKKLIFTALN